MSYHKIFHKGIDIAGAQGMEIRILRYFVEVAVQGNFTAAAEALSVTQPTLSKQIMEFEEELGKKLFVRGKKRTVLTEAGERMLKRAREILELADRAKKDISGDDGKISGELHIAGGETRTMRIVGKVLKNIRKKYPEISFHLFSGNAEAVSERLAKGLSDYGVFVQPANLGGFDYVNLSEKDRWGILVRKDHPLASLPEIRPADIGTVPLICSAQAQSVNEILGWMGNTDIPVNIIGTYTLLYNAAIMAEEGVGAVLCLDGIADTSAESNICFRPLTPRLEVNMAIAWKKGVRFSPAASAFHKELDEIIHGSAVSPQDGLP